MHDAQEVTIDAYGSEIIPALSMTVSASTATFQRHPTGSTRPRVPAQPLITCPGRIRTAVHGTGVERIRR